MKKSTIKILLVAVLLSTTVVVASTAWIAWKVVSLAARMEFKVESDQWTKLMSESIQVVLRDGDSIQQRELLIGLQESLGTSSDPQIADWIQTEFQDEIELLCEHDDESVSSEARSLLERINHGKSDVSPASANKGVEPKLETTEARNGPD